MTQPVRSPVEALRSRAHDAARAGDSKQSEACFRELLLHSPEDIEALNVLGMQALAQARPADAEALLQRALTASPMHSGTLKNLGILKLQSRDFSAAVSILEQAVANDDNAFAARLYLGLAHERSGHLPAASAHYLSAVTSAQALGLWRGPDSTPTGLRPVVEHAMRMIRLHQRQTVEHVMAPLRSRYGDSELTRVRRCLANYLGEEIARPASSHQRPSFLYFPGLPETPFFDRSLFPWYQAMESVWADIRDEMQEALEADTALTPFLGAPPPGMESSYLTANGDQAPRWDGLFFHRHGVRYDSNCARCPITADTLEAAPLVRIRNHSPEALFSVLGPGSHILPHTGVTNTRVTTHLPLVVPGDCAIKVAGQTHAWKAGQCVSFDDSFEHEAWNRSGEIRVILLFDVWNPHLDPVECEALTHIVAALGDAQSVPA